MITEIFGKIFCGLMKVSWTSYHQSSMVVTVCFAASGPGRVAVIDETMNCARYQKIMKKNIWISAQALKLKGTWVMQ